MIKSRLYYNSPIGNLEIVGSDEGIEKIIFIHMLTDLRSCCPGLNNFTTIASNTIEKNLDKYPDIIRECVTQLDEYFNGIRKEFKIKLNPKGTEFQQKIWEIVSKVSYGKTSTYLELAIGFGDSKAVRAVGNANGRNPIPIIIPCHRIIGTNGKLTGYAGGLIRKQWLLNHESNTDIKLFS